MFYYYIYNFKKLIKKKNKILTVSRLCGEFLSSFLYFYSDFFLRPAFSPPPSNFFSFFFIKDFKKIFSRHRDPRIITNCRLITNFFFFFLYRVRVNEWSEPDLKFISGFVYRVFGFYSYLFILFKRLTPHVYCVIVVT